MKAVIIMGSRKDSKFGNQIARHIEGFGIKVELRFASAHKAPLRVLEIIREFEDEEVVFVTVAGRSNALSGMVDANTAKPVIACPPYSEKFAGLDVLSSLRMPSGVAPMVVLEAENAALAVAKILGIKHESVLEAIRSYQEGKRKEALE
jgi:5-(carboxyamino)imidazole ribonucleotide mutase